MKFKCSRFASLLLLSLTVCAGVATAQLPDCNCYFNNDCPAEKPICQISLTGGGPIDPTHPDRACEWMEPKPTGGPGTGCDQTYDGNGGPCDGICIDGPPIVYSQQWNHRGGVPGVGYNGSGCLPGGPYSYFVKFVVENEGCNLPSHCSLCETDVLIPSGTLATGTAALVASQLTADCSVEGFTFDVTDRRVSAEIAGQIFDVCVNGVKVASAVSPPGTALVCQDGANPTTHQVAGEFLPLPSLSLEGFAVLIALMLAGSFVALFHRPIARGP